MNTILLVTIIAVLFAALSLFDRLNRKRRANRAPLGSDLRNDRDTARLRTEIDANVDHRPAARDTHRRAA